MPKTNCSRLDGSGHIGITKQRCHLQQNVGCVHVTDEIVPGVVVSVAHWQRPQTAATFDHFLANTVGMVSLQLKWRRKAVLQTTPSGRRRGVRSSLTARGPDHGHFCASSYLTYFSGIRPHLAILK